MTASARDERPREHGLAGSRDRTPDEQSAPERERFFELSADLLCTTGSDGKFGIVNPAFRELLGYELADLVSRPAVDFIHPEDVASTLAARERLAPGGPLRFENRVRCRDGSYRRLSWCASRDASGTVYATARHLTAEKSADEKLRALIKEKEVLLSEAHHRVKNSLQLVSSLIGMQLRQLVDEPARDALEECRMRVLAIALIHEQLCQSKDSARVPLVEYVGGLTHNIFRAAASSAGQLTLELAIEPIWMAVEKAVTCGLLLNELITNAVKHGFPDGRAGVIRLELYCRDGQVQLVLSDDGVGLAVDLDVERSPSLGVRLIRTLAEQLEATIEFTRERGTAVRVAFVA